MNWKLVITIMGLLSSVFLIGCSEDDNVETVHSDAIATVDIWSLFQVVSDGEGYVQAEAQLTRGQPPADPEANVTYVKLVADDELWLSAGPDIESLTFTDDIFGGFSALEDSQALFVEAVSTPSESYEFLFIRVESIEDGRWYSARLPVSEEREYRVVLFRNSDVGTSDREPDVVLPLAYEITSPTIETSSLHFSRSEDDILIEWDSIDSLATVELEANTTCLDDAVGTFVGEPSVLDSGSVTISAGALVSESLSGTCSTTVHIRKVRRGEFDSNFSGGRIVGYEIRSIAITTVD